jgi:hypothetical protein
MFYGIKVGSAKIRLVLFENSWPMFNIKAWLKCPHFAEVKRDHENKGPS